MKLTEDLFQKNNWFIILTMFTIVTNFFSCATKQKTVQLTADAPVLITYEKERSRGNRLPLYSIEVLENKVVRYTGKANVSNIGEQLTLLQDAQYERIINKLEEVDFKNLKASYKGNKRDLALTSITCNGHKVTYQQVACPEKLGELAVLLESIDFE